MAARVLIIDDDERLAEMLAGYLTSRGFVVETRATARAGWLALESWAFDALILDVMLPDGDGLELCRKLRARSDGASSGQPGSEASSAAHLANLPILMLTARGDATDRVVGLELGADDYLPKPFDPRELLARLGAILRRSRPAVASGSSGVGGASVGGTGMALRFGELVIDRQARQVFVRGEARELTGRQFDLLVLLAERAGRVQTREQITDGLGGEAWDVVDRAIDVHVSRIRNVIEDDPKHPRYLRTIRGAGYLFTGAGGPSLPGGGAGGPGDGAGNEPGAA
jgi:DNA-binding response OmpR family regulator